MTKREKTAPAPPRALVPQIAKLEDHLTGDQSFMSAYARALGAVACADGALTLAEFAVLTDIARAEGASAVLNALILHSIEQGIGLDEALNALSKSHEDVDRHARELAFLAAKPLLALQSHGARPLANRLAAALDLKLSPIDFEDLPPEDAQGFLGTLKDKTRRIVKGRDVADSVADFGRNIGDADLISKARAYQSGALTPNVLRETVLAVVTSIDRDIDAYQEKALIARVAESTAANLVSTANELKRQVEQRLAIVDERIWFERTTFNEDVEDAVHDGGNAIELAMSDRLNTDKWKDNEVWESIGRTQFGQEMERRIDRIARRREEALKLLKEDLRLFQADIRMIHASILDRQHYSALAKSMPRLRIGTQIVNTVDTAANFTLISAAAALAGAGAVAYVVGVAVVLPVIAPAAPFLGGAVVVAGLFKWFTDSGKRKRAEIRDKRRAFEEAFRKSLAEASISFNAQLDQVASGFRVSSAQLLTPIMLEAEAAKRLQGMRQRITDRVIARTHASIKQVNDALTKL